MWESEYAKSEEELELSVAKWDAKRVSHLPPDHKQMTPMTKETKKRVEKRENNRRSQRKINNGRIRRSIGWSP